MSIENEVVVVTGASIGIGASDWDRTIDVNIKGFLYGINAVLPSGCSTVVTALLSRTSSRSTMGGSPRLSR
ncbi:MAG: hypothetical protein AAF500_14725 [Myxococcota bacterium]